jgi:hypothetical protein
VLRLAARVSGLSSIRLAANSSCFAQAIIIQLLTNMSNEGLYAEPNTERDMAITLRLRDFSSPASKLKFELVFEISFPTRPLSVIDAAKLALQSARDKGFKERPEEWFITLKEPGKHAAYSFVSQEKAAEKMVPDGSIVTVTGQGRLNSRSFVLE